MNILSSNPITAQVKAIIIAVVVIVGVSLIAYSGYWLYNKGYESCDAQYKKSELSAYKENAKENAKTDAEFNNADKKLIETINSNEQAVKIVTKIVEKEIEKPIYVDTIVPASGMLTIATSARTLNSARISRSTTSEVRSDSSTGQ